MMNLCGHRRFGNLQSDHAAGGLVAVRIVRSCCTASTLREQCSPHGSPRQKLPMRLKCRARRFHYDHD